MKGSRMEMLVASTFVGQPLHSKLNPLNDVVTRLVCVRTGGGLNEYYPGTAKNKVRHLREAPAG